MVAVSPVFRVTVIGSRAMHCVNVVVCRAADPVVTTRESERGPWSVSAAIQNPPVAPVLDDGLFAHTERPTGLWEADIQIPNIDCPNCVLQVIQFMAEHAKNMDGDYSYHHCAVVDITADPSKPLDNRWGHANR